MEFGSVVGGGVDSLEMKQTAGGRGAGTAAGLYQPLIRHKLRPERRETCSS